MRKFQLLFLLLVLTLLVSACGGGGSADSSSALTDVGGDVQQKVDLSWSAPSTRTDGTPLSLSELVGYRVYYGTSPDALQLQEEIVGVSETGVSISNLAPGTYYFAVTAYDVDGLESGFSQIVSKVIS